MADDPNQIPDQNLTPPSEPIPTEETKSEEVPQKPNPEITNPTDTNTSTQEPKPEEPTVTPAVSIAPATNLFIPQLHYPFSGTFAVTFSFGAKSDNEEIKKKFTEWGITGHNGLDFGLTEGTDVYPCDNGRVIQSGENGDFGNSVTIEHSWGTSLYAHLKETKINVGDNAEVNKVIGISGKTGAAFGEHLHLAIKPNNPDVNNGYLGFIDPSSYLSLPSQKEEPKEETKQEGQKSEETQQQPTEEVPPPIKLEPEKPVEQKEEPQQPETPQNPQAGDEEIQRQVEEKLKTELDLRRQKANEARQTKREENLMRIEKLIEEKKQINNDDVRELLHISQSTATEYLKTLVNRDTIKTEGKGKATVYHY
ncbi:MAG: peptidase M23 [uncultured bacterium]|uniref:Peptidase M23 family protein n=1 Tax=Candidatus Daviesbacteria bacterium GW2011_GWC2_40_12 TaxID=1618431 RepID=A0A0G0TTW8_9BACT|nr:MAG: peptidase M23 [uncultured bacterium]KKR16488.1 MAG: Peptidase M23 family protein [Candidatus Daviesbacteria bacterium GW2011_GWA2_39_33]KKR24061.1 MAG: Peptidase M23 family protein [Candidatus Daviesbacteria bacterium GW2011_GWB1_39_5]KKR41337.1 MAG: Peptidase M23 family protein [Candidatus Daviesbacteria bacterium GW2011_GWC2_40_12]OGE21462.1 MAG: hypothetical protein A2778_01080 [Candidatus Daviesbacteria bacterium RIFCSPHIGHO2_01_FULL_40_24]OGE29800.1 MAG: hypothetical protein A3C29